jgi:small-conductance mechanosensitive channel
VPAVDGLELSLSWSDFLDPATWPGALLYAVVLFFGARLASRLLGKLMTRSHWMLGRLGRRVDEIIVRYAVQVKTLLIYVAAGVLYASLVPGLHTLVNTILAGAGITAVVVGFAARSTLSNLVAGLSIAVYRPIRIGDKLTIENDYGYVEDITLRHTIVRTWENKRLVIPNEKLDNLTIVNHSIVDQQIMCPVEMGVSYDTGVELARRLMLEAAGECPHRLQEGAPSPPVVRVVEIRDFAVILRLYLWTSTMDEAWLARFWLLEEIKKRFDAGGVEIPFPYRTLVFKKDLPAAVGPTPAGGEPPEAGQDTGQGPG